MKKAEFKTQSGTRLLVSISDKVFKKYTSLVGQGFQFMVDIKRGPNYHLIVVNTQKHDIVGIADAKSGTLTEVAEGLINAAN